MLRAQCLLLSALAWTALARCSVFDASLVPHDDSGAPSTEGGDEQTAMASSIAVSGACETAPLLTTMPTAPVPLVITDGSCGDNPPPVVSCLDGPLGGHSFYFAFQSAVDMNDTNPQTWHLSVRDTEGDVALYLLNSCATPSCADMNSGVRSSTYHDLSFAVTPGQKYVVAVNTSNQQSCDGAQLPKVLLQHDRCLDGVVENGEACDPPNPSCVACQYTLLSQDSQGSEPNDSPLEANIIPVGPTPFTMTGSVGQGLPEPDASLAVVDPYDFFGLQLTDGLVSGAVRVSLSWHEPLSEGAACVDAFLAAIYVSDKWHDPSNVGHSGIQSGPAVGGPDPDGAQLIECNTSIDIPFDVNIQSTIAGMSRYFIRVASAPNKHVAYELSVDEIADP